jgi:hypothetical protein
VVKAKIIIIFFLIVGFNLKAQQPNFFSRSEIGVHVGSMYYIGDLNQFKPFYQSKLAGGFMYRFTVHSRLSLRVNYTVGNVEAFDSDSKKAMNINIREYQLKTNHLQRFPRNIRGRSAKGGAGGGNECSAGISTCSFAFSK